MYHIATNVIRTVTATTTSLIIRLLVDCVLVLDCSIITPRYTVINCFGNERIAARQNTMMPMPQVENTAVVTDPHFSRQSEVMLRDETYSDQVSRSSGQ